MIKKIKSLFVSKDPKIEGMRLNEWIELIQFGDFKAREKAVNVVPRYGESAVPALIKALRVRDKSSRHAIVKIFAKIGPSTVEILKELLASPGDTSSGNGGIFETVAESKMTTVNGNYQIPTDIDWTVRIRCAESLAEIGADACSSVPLLTAISKNPDEPREVRHAAFEAIQKIDPRLMSAY